VSPILRSVVTGVGAYLPEEIVTNAELSKVVDTNDAWIVERTGIHERRRASPDQGASDLAVEAAKKALAAAGRSSADLDLIIVATTTPDLTFPPPRHRATQARRAHRDRLRHPGGVLGLCLRPQRGRWLRGSRSCECALVIGAETMTRLMDWTDRGTCVLFGDGAGAVVLEPGQGRGTPPIADCSASPCAATATNRTFFM